MANLVRRGDYSISDWDPLRMVRELLRWDPFRAASMLSSDGDLWIPQFEVRENGNAIRILADVPGIKRDELEISINGNRLIVTGRREAEQRHKDENVHAYERQFGQFTRAFTLPENIDVDHITSELRDGVLTIVAPLKAGTKARKIQIGGTQPKS